MTKVARAKGALGQRGRGASLFPGPTSPPKAQSTLGYKGWKQELSCFWYFPQTSKEFKPHTGYSGIFEQISLYNLLVRMQTSSLSPVWAPADHLTITPRGYSRRQSKPEVVTADSMAVGHHSGTACAGQTGPDWLLLQSWLYSRVKSFLVVCNFFRCDNIFEMKFLMDIVITCYTAKP